MRWLKSVDFGSSWWLLLPVALALALRVFALDSLRQTPYFHYLLWDERLYHDWAAKIADGAFASKTVYEFSPLPAYVMALVYRLFSPDPLYVRYLNIAFGTASCALVYGIGNKTGPKPAGLLAGLLAAVYEPLVFYSVVPLKTAMGVFLFALTIFFFLRAMESPAPGNRLFLGIAAGLLINVRPNALVLVPAFFLLLLWACRRQGCRAASAAGAAGVFFLGFCLAVSPFVFRNLIVARRPALTTSQAGFNLFLGNHQYSPDPYYRPVPFAVTSPLAQGVQFTIEASRRRGARLSPEEASRYWEKKVFDIAAEQPAAFFAKLFRKALAVFNRFEAGDHYDIGFLRRETGFLAGLPIPGFGVVFPLGAAGLLWGAFRRSERAAWLLALFLLYGATLIVFFTNARYRLPLLVVLLPYASAALIKAYQMAKARRFRPLLLLCGIAAGGLVLEMLPVRGTEDATAYYNTNAVVLAKAGKTREAISYWEASSQMNKGFSDFAALSLAGLYLSRGDIRPAKKWLAKIPDGSFAEAQKQALLGDLALRRGRLDDAVGFYRSALSINSGLLNPRARLIALFKDRNPALAKEEWEKARYVERFYREARGK